MTPAGWIFMSVSIGFVLTLAVFCYCRVLRPPTSAGRDAARESGRHDTQW